jgi:hypothetical protein
LLLPSSSGWQEQFYSKSAIYSGENRNLTEQTDRINEPYSSGDGGVLLLRQRNWQKSLQSIAIGNRLIEGLESCASFLNLPFSFLGRGCSAEARTYEYLRVDVLNDCVWQSL